MERYQAKRAGIIGGTSGMGLATAKMLLDGGARVLVTGRSQAGLKSAQQELGTGAIVVSSDARSLTDIDALASRLKAEFDTVDLLFVNAGFSIRAALESVTEAVYDEMFNLNAKGPFFAVQKLAPLINRGGSVVLTTSIANVKGMPGNAQGYRIWPRIDRAKSLDHPERFRLRRTDMSRRARLRMLRASLRSVVRFSGPSSLGLFSIIGILPFPEGRLISEREPSMPSRPRGSPCSPSNARPSGSRS
jgi:NAD(P)-dependent dehydrogenase (short-subunit alcohol dehydrogenase family)